MEDVGDKLLAYHPFSERFVLQAQLAARVRLEHPDLRFFVLSDVWLDHPDTLPGLEKMFENCMANSFIPKVIILCGNFSSKGVTQGNSREIREYQGMIHIPVCREQ